MYELVAIFGRSSYCTRDKLNHRAKAALRHAFSAWVCVFKVITLHISNSVISFQTQTHAVNAR